MTLTSPHLTQSLKNSLKQFSLQPTSTTDQIRSQLLSLQIQSDDDILKLNTFLQKEIKTLLFSVMENGNLTKVAQLISLLCDISIQQKYGQNHTTKPLIKQSLAIIIVQQVLQCLGINDLKQILPIISQKICSFKQLDVIDQNRMLRIINHLLKRISKTEDYLVRGQLQFTLTKILPICHDSGFHYRIPIAKGIEIAENQQAEGYKDIFSSDGITYQFYKDFWELQRYLMDPNELSSEGLLKNGSEQTPKKATQIYKTEPLISLRLRHMEKVLTDVVSYMREHSCGESSISLLNQPIKFLTNTHLLEFQLSDEYFRKIILTQVLLFTFTLTHLKPTGSILKGVMLTESERQTINRIDSVAQKYLESLEKNKRTSQALVSEPSIFQTMKCFFANELQWLQLKDHWKQKKKVFLRTEPVAEVEQKQKKLKETIVDYNKKIAQVNQKIAKQMNIDGDTLLNFLTQPCVPHIVTTPTQTSFAYYWSQAKACLDTFDYEKIEQHQFQTKTEYNVFEWKAMRSLYKEAIREHCLAEKNPKLREFRALAFAEKKEREFKEQQAKDQETKLNPENSALSEPKSNNLFVIEQVAENKDVSKGKNITENVSDKNIHPNQVQNNNESGSPSKKQKLQ